MRLSQSRGRQPTGVDGGACTSATGQVVRRGGDRERLKEIAERMDRVLDL